MKLLFDENLSPKLASRLASYYPDGKHVREVGLRGRPDHEIWAFATVNGCVIVSKDTDFRERSYLEGFPPKVIWLDVGNAGTSAIADLLDTHRNRVLAFESLEEQSLLILSISGDAI